LVIDVDPPPLGDALFVAVARNEAFERDLDCISGALAFVELNDAVTVEVRTWACVRDMKRRS
jgi:hypothetical protein